MNLSNLVHESRREQSGLQHPFSHPAQQPQDYLATKYHQNTPQDMASISAMKPTSYPSQAQVFARSPRPPPSPPVDAPSLTLPSIHNLIGMADGSSPRSNPGETEASRPQAQQQVSKDHAAEPRSYGTYGHPSVSNPRALPPTPPLRPNSGFDGSHQSPSAASTRSSVSAAHFSANAINNLEPHQQRQPGHVPAVDSYAVPARHPAQSPYTTTPYGSPSTMSNYSYTSPVTHANITSGMYYQRPLPPPDMPLQRPHGLSTPHNLSPIDHTNPWQHHHYISPSASAAFANQQTDRYICQTCNKAFSRPSSLRIHSHSHTGEKPFKCPHIGCGKAFSVRSNMKRHERGCHGSGSPGSI